jgi:dTDP-4-amino-4,6-dideoxygalactose transaminase
MIPVTKPFSPPIEEYYKYLEIVWNNNWFTNNGPLVLSLEEKLKNYLNLNNLLFVSNGTVALQLVLKSLGVKGEIITTPFSYVATTSSIIWENNIPVFVDIDSESLNIDPSKIENSITPNTIAILATHVYGNPCEIDEIQKIAERHKIKVIYDAAHCFGTSYKGKSIFQYGDFSTASFHSTKIFHTIEGGAVFSKNHDDIERISKLRNFGHDGPEAFSEVGINGKNSEFHAAMGLTNFNFIEEIFINRKNQSLRYLSNLSASDLKFVKINSNAEYNYAYFPVIFQSEEKMMFAKKVLENSNIYTRRYFYPSLNTVSVFNSNLKMEISEDISRRILCLPLYHTLRDADIDKICEILLDI